MSLQLRILIIIMVLLTGLLAVKQIKARHLELQYIISWMFLLFVILIVSIFPGILNWLSGLMGIELPINMVFFLGFVFTLLISYSLTRTVSKMSREITELSQKIALIDKENREKETENK